MCLSELPFHLLHHTLFSPFSPFQAQKATCSPIPRNAPSRSSLRQVPALLAACPGPEQTRRRVNQRSCMLMTAAARLTLLC